MSGRSWQLLNAIITTLPNPVLGDFAYIAISHVDPDHQFSWSDTFMRMAPSDHFKNGHQISNSSLARELCKFPTNDNDLNVLMGASNEVAQAEDTKLIRAALNLVAVHGVNAAQEAHAAALEAMHQHDETGFSHWRSVCAKLDGRLAQTLVITSEAG